jgi:Ca2+-binding RTX toxin-like protein
LQSNVTTLNAGSFTGAIVMDDAARTISSVANTNTMSISGGTGSDTIIMTNGNDTLSGGSGVDTLKMSMQLIGGNGYTVVDLSSSSDQISAVRGVSNAAVQSGFENFDGSLSTGNGQFDITARAAGSTIVGGANADVITGGAGNDSITGGTGADVISILSGGNDTIRYAAGGTGTFTAPSNGTLSISTSSFDVIYGVGAGLGRDFVDLLSFGYSTNGSVATNVLVSTALAASTASNAVNQLTGVTGTSADNAVVFIRGTYSAGTNTFLESANQANSGADSLMVFDTNAVSGAASYAAVVLVGATGVLGIGGAGGLITFS